MSIETIDIPELHRRFKAQGVSSRQHIAVICPMCATVQSMRSLINAGAGKTEDEVERYVGFSCVGRFTGEGSALSDEERQQGKGCDWTLGGLFKLHKLEVIDPEGRARPYFQIASPDQAQALERHHQQLVQA